jgi:DNA-binding beta-propeller fold protein YncE
VPHGLLTRNVMTRAAYSRVVLVAGVAIAIAVAPAPSALHAQGAKVKDKKADARGVPVWPLPPEPTRVRYLTTYHGSDDFKTKKPGRWKTALLGNSPEGPPSDTFVKPYAIAVSPQGRVFVSDTAARRVFAIDPDHRTMSFLGDHGNAALTKPVGIAVDDAGVVFVADATLKRVFGFAPDGTVVIAIGRDGEFETPSGLAIDRVRKLVYVVDSSKHQVVCYSTVDGMRVRVIGHRGGDAGEFNFPTNAFVDNRGQLYVADTLNFRVQIFDLEGRFVRTFGTQGDTPGTLNRPKGIAVDGEGHVYVADTSFNNFQIFDAEGQLLLFVGSAGRGPGEFLLPAGLFIDTRDRIYVADQGNSRVQVFQYERAK